MRHLSSVGFFLISASVVAGLARDTAAQRLAGYDPIAGLVTELQPPTVFLAVPNPPLATYPSAPVLPPPVPGAPMPGDATFDNLTGVLWFTEGFTLASMPLAVFPPLVPPLFPVLPIPAAVIGMIGGPVTGIAIDPVAGVMFLSSIPGMVVGVGLVPGLPVVVPPFPVAPPLGPIAGLEWDGMTGSLWAVDVAGTVQNFLVGGAPLGPPIPPIVPMPGPAGDVAIDKLGNFNPAGFRPLYVSAGPMVFDTLDPAPIPFPAGPLAIGLAFVDAPAATPPVGFCGCPGLAGPANFSTSVMASGNGAFAIGMTGLAPFGVGIFAFDPAFNPLFPMINLVGCPLGMLTAPIITVALADPFGTVTLPVSLAAVPVGLGLYNQNATFCPADPLGLVLTPMQTVVAGGF